MRTPRDSFKFLEDFARMATGAVGSLAEVRAQMKSMAKEQVDQILSRMDMVTREEFDRVEAMAQKARQRQETLEKRLAALEKRQIPKSTTKKKKKV